MKLPEYRPKDKIPVSLDQILRSTRGGLSLLHARRTSLEREVEEDRIRQLRSVAEDLDRQLGFLEAVNEDRITELATHALGRLLRPTNGDPRP